MQIPRTHNPTPILLSQNQHDINSSGTVERPCGSGCAASTMGRRPWRSRRRCGVQSEVSLDGQTGRRYIYIYIYIIYIWIYLYMAISIIYIYLEEVIQRLKTGDLS